LNLEINHQYGKLKIMKKVLDYDKLLREYSPRGKMTGKKGAFLGLISAGISAATGIIGGINAGKQRKKAIKKSNKAYANAYEDQLDFDAYQDQQQSDAIMSTYNPQGQDQVYANKGASLYDIYQEGGGAYPDSLLEIGNALDPQKQREYMELSSPAPPPPAQETGISKYYKKDIGNMKKDFYKDSFGMEHYNNEDDKNPGNLQDYILQSSNITDQDPSELAAMAIQEGWYYNAKDKGNETIVPGKGSLDSWEVAGLDVVDEYSDSIKDFTNLDTSKLNYGRTITNEVSQIVSPKNFKNAQDMFDVQAGVYKTRAGDMDKLAKQMGIKLTDEQKPYVNYMAYNTQNHQPDLVNMKTGKKGRSATGYMKTVLESLRGKGIFDKSGKEWRDAVDPKNNPYDEGSGRAAIFKNAGNFYNRLQYTSNAYGKYDDDFSKGQGEGVVNPDRLYNKNAPRTIEPVRERTRDEGRTSEGYNIRRAMELGLKPDAKGNWPMLNKDNNEILAGMSSDRMGELFDSPEGKGKGIYRDPESDKLFFLPTDSPETKGLNPEKWMSADDQWNLSDNAEFQHGGKSLTPYPYQDQPGKAINPTLIYGKPKKQVGGAGMVYPDSFDGGSLMDEQSFHKMKYYTGGKGNMLNRLKDSSYDEFNAYQNGGSATDQVPGGELQQLTDRGQVVKGDDPGLIDDVELGTNPGEPQAVVDHNEVIIDAVDEQGKPFKQIFSDTVYVPGKNVSMAKEAKKYLKQMPEDEESEQAQYLYKKLDDLFEMQQMLNGDSSGETAQEAAQGGMDPNAAQGMEQEGSMAFIHGGKGQLPYNQYGGADYYNEGMREQMMRVPYQQKKGVYLGGHSYQLGGEGYQEEFNPQPAPQGLYGQLSQTSMIGGQGLQDPMSEAEQGNLQSEQIQNMGSYNTVSNYGQQISGKLNSAAAMQAKAQGMPKGGQQIIGGIAKGITGALGSGDLDFLENSPQPLARRGARLRLMHNGGRLYYSSPLNKKSLFLQITL